MKNKNVGFLIIVISIVIGIIILIFNLSLRNIVSQTCSHGSSCSMYGTLSLQTWVSLIVAFLILAIGLFLVLSKENETIIIKKIKERAKKKKINLNNLDNNEKKVVELLLKENKAMFQSDLMEKLEIGKVKTTRLLDRLEAKQFIERKRRGMNNIVILKH